MTPLLDTVPPEMGIKKGLLNGRIWDGWSKTKVLGGLLKRSAKLEQKDIA
jgi:hypothetical protein